MTSERKTAPKKDKAAREVAKNQERRAPTQREKAAFEAARVASDAMPVRPAYDIEISDTTAKFDARHSDAQGEANLLAQSVASRSPDFMDVAVSWLLEASQQRGRPITSVRGNAALAAVAAFEPRNEAETLLAVQAFATHDLAMDMMVRSRRADTFDQMQQYVSMATKLSRTFTAQMEAFGKLKRGGEQVVRHIHVDNRGGQAVIAETVNTGNGNNEIFDGQTHAQSPCSPALLGQDTEGNGVPISRDQGEAAMQDAWGEESRRAQGQ